MRIDRNPFEVYLLIACVLAGVLLLFTPATPATMAATLSPVLVDLWSAMLSVGGFVALSGIVWRNRVTGVALEQVGLVSTGAASVVYAAAIFVVNPVAGYVAASLIGAFGLACLVRWKQLRDLLRAAQHEIEAHAGG